MKTALHIQKTSDEEAFRIAGELDWASVETERLTGTDPMVSLRGSLTVWDGDAPLCCYGFTPPEGERPAQAWMMVTHHARGRGRARDVFEMMREALADAVSLYGRVIGYALMRGDAPRMLAMLGATFALPMHPSFVCWELRDNPQLRRAS